MKKGHELFAEFANVPVGERADWLENLANQNIKMKAIPTKNKIWIMAFGLFLGVWAGITNESVVDFFLMTLVVTNFGILSWYANEN